MTVVTEKPAMVSRTRPVDVDLEAEADRDRCGALKDFWYVACTSEELGTRKPIGRIVLGVPIVLFRNGSGAPAALRDRCLHRNAQLSCGDVLAGGRLGCPYHGWTYDDAGRCVEIPSLGPAQRGQVLDEAGHARSGLRMTPGDVGRLERFPAIEQDGLVFVYLGGDPTRARRPPFRTPFWKAPGWTSYYMVTRFPNGITNLVENFMDVPHTAVVHRGWFRNPSQKQVPATVERVDGSVLVTYQQDQDQVEGLGKLFNPGGAPMVHTDKYYIPNVTRVDYTFGDSGFVITSQCTPVGPTDTLVYTAIAYRLPFGGLGAVVARAMQRIFKWYTTRVILQDVDIMRIQRDGLVGSPGGGVFVSTEADLLHADVEAYRSWLRSGGEGTGPADERRQIAFWV
jgi:phenylpropionate dioxygenase-like ring-hydroxylating dioxygenase large terminal subunit